METPDFVRARIDGMIHLKDPLINTALAIKAIKSEEFERVIIDSTVEDHEIAYSVDSRLLEIAGHRVVNAAKRAGITLKQAFAKQEGDRSTQ